MAELKLPVYGEKLTNPNNALDTFYHTIGNFNLTNQYGETIDKKTVDGKIYVADFFFATCQSICPRMSSNLAEVQKNFLNDPEVLILSHTVNPMHDTVEVLNEYAKGYGAVKGKWHFLTGNKQYIYDLAKNGYLVNALQDDGTPEGFLHSEIFVLVDKKSRIRGTYDGTDSISVDKLIKDIRLLETEK
ncbi:MAG: SCO family protein [Bacteroidetes bacterium]|nr:SCO family protein [Bacteroidota bacterium]